MNNDFTTEEFNNRISNIPEDELKGMISRIYADNAAFRKIMNEELKGDDYVDQLYRKYSRKLWFVFNMDYGPVMDDGIDLVKANVLLREGKRILHEYMMVTSDKTRRVWMQTNFLDCGIRNCRNPEKMGLLYRTSVENVICDIIDLIMTDEEIFEAMDERLLVMLNKFMDIKWPFHKITKEKIRVFLTTKYPDEFEGFDAEAGSAKEANDDSEDENDFNCPQYKKANYDIDDDEFDFE